MHSIRYKITALTIGAILTAILCVFLASLSTVRTESDRRSVETMNLICQDTAKSLEKYIQSIDQSTEMAASIASDMLDVSVLFDCGVVGSSVTTQQRTSEQQDVLDTYLAEYSTGLQSEFATIASHTYGVITYYYCITPDVSTTVHGFFYSKVGKTGFSEREPLDAREFDPNDMEHYTWYYTPIERGRPSWIGPYTAHFLNEMHISSYLVPIYKSGTFIGVLGMDIPVETLTMQVSTIKVYDTGFACLLDQNGNVVYHPNLPYGSVPQLAIDENLFEQENSTDKLIRYSAEGQDRQMSFTTLSNGMKLVVVAPTAEVNASTIRLTSMIAGIAVAVIAIFTVLILIATRYLTRPLLRLTAASQRLAAADYDVALDYRGNDEVGALTTAFERMRDQLKENIEDLNRKVHIDDLTGLPNQRYFFELAEAERQRLLNDGKRPAMLYFNLVGMKHFNRQYGFEQGDCLIRDVASILANEFGALCTSRFAQDHFAAMTDEDCVESSLHAVFEECRRANGSISLPVNVGIYPYRLEEVDVSVACDRAKYACDRRRGFYVSGYRYFDASMIRQLELVRYVTSNLDKALERHWIKVYYQPIIRAANGKMCDVECLARWDDPKRGLLSPADFIPSLESAGLIYKLDLYVLEQALGKIAAQRLAGFTVVPHSINLSRSDFDSCDIVEEIRSRVDASGVERNMITIEITESIIGSNFTFMKQQVERFQDLGFPVWMDDFGSGYSSLDVLQDIEFDLLKFDMSFMRKFDEGDNGKIILTDLIQMAIALGVDTVCEGVETNDQYRFLRRIGCSKLQGYYFCKPIPFEELIARYGEGKQIGYEDPK